MGNNRERRHTAEQTAMQQQNHNQTSELGADNHRQNDQRRVADPLQTKINAHQEKTLAWADRECTSLAKEHRAMQQELRHGPEPEVQAVTNALEQFAMNQRSEVESLKDIVEGLGAIQRPETAKLAEPLQGQTNRINAMLASVARDATQTEARRANQGPRVQADVPNLAQYAQELTRVLEQSQGQLTSMLKAQQSEFLQAAHAVLKGRSPESTLDTVLADQATKRNAFAKETHERVRELTEAFERTKEYGAILSNRVQEKALEAKDKQLLSTSGHIQTSEPDADNHRQNDQRRVADPLQTKINAYQEEKLAWADRERTNLVKEHRAMQQELRHGPEPEVQAVDKAMEQFAMNQRNEVEALKRAVEEVIGIQRQEAADLGEQQQLRTDIVNMVLTSMAHDNNQAEAFRADQARRMQADIPNLAQYAQELTRVLEQSQGQLTSMLKAQQSEFLQAAHAVLKGRSPEPMLDKVLADQATKRNAFTKETHDRVRELAEAFERAKELATFPKLKEWNDQIQALRQTNPDKAAEEAVRLIRTLEAVGSNAANIGNDRNVEPEPSFALHMGEKRAEQIRSGEKNFVIDRAITFDIDEVLPVGAADIASQEARARALDPYNRQLLDPHTNQFTKGLGIDIRELREHRGEYEPVSVVDNPAALITRRFSEVHELKRIFDRAVASVKEPHTRTPTKLKAYINKEIRRIITEDQKSDAVAVRKAFAALGFEHQLGLGFTMMKDEDED